jgi:RNA recognition motif-containing protein
MTSIFVAKLDFGVSNQELRQLFENYGTVLKATVATDRETGKPRGFAFVEMADRQEALRAIEALDGHVINGRALAVKEAEQRTDNRPNPRPAFSPRENAGPTRTSDSSAPRPEARTNDSIDSSADSSFILPKVEPRKKAKEKERKVEDDNRNKKPKMDAYKKSGKNPRFFEDDEDDLDDDLLTYKKPDEDDFDDEDDEDDDF